MPDSVCTLVCRHYAAEADRVCQRSELQRIRVGCFSTRCGRPPLGWEDLEALRQRPDEPLVVFGGPCLANLDATEARARGLFLHRFQTCQEMLLNGQLLQAYLDQRAYVMTPGWLEHWRSHLEADGQDQELVRSLWREAVTKLLLLDTGVADSIPALQAISKHLDLPGEVLPVGLDHLQLLMERGILEARLQIQNHRAEGSLNLAQRQAADRATAIEFLGALSQSLKEEDVIQGIVDLFTLLCHAERVQFLPTDGQEAPALPVDCPYEQTEHGFTLPIATSMGLAGHLKVEGLAFPKFKAHYLNLAISMAGVCALAIQNARAYRAAEESRAYQRLILNILDVFYQPQGSLDDLESVLEEIQSFAGVEALALRLREQGRFNYSHARGYPPEFVAASCEKCLHAMLGDRSQAPTGFTRTTRGSLWINDLQASGSACPCQTQGFRSVALIQLTLHGGVVGAIQLHHREPGLFTPVLIERLEGVARSIGIGLERRWAEEDLRRVNRELESRVQQRTAELAHINQELRQEIQERTRAEAHLESRSLELQMRLKELHCLYELSNLFEQHDGTVEALCHQAIQLIPGGWNRPDSTWARLQLDEREFCSPGFHETPFSLQEPITINGVPRGSLEVHVRPQPGSPAFLEEEQGLLKTIADLIQGLVDHVEVETEKRKVEQQLVQSQKLEALGTLAGGIAHDFNNALTPIISLADLSLMKLPEDSPLRRHIEIIKKSGDRAKDLVNQILLFSRKKAPDLKCLDLANLLQEIMKLIRATLPSTIEIRQDLEWAEAKVLGDPTHLHQIVMNLCTNAYHAMQETGGILTVRLKRASVCKGDAFDAMGLDPGNYAELEVSDTGIGMNRELQARIFEPFFTTKGPGKGTGMGLAVIHGIVSSYQGRISVYSEPGQGTTFRILLPLVEAEIESSAGPVSPPDIPRGSECILVVDDEESIRMSLSALLGNLGYAIITAADGPEALQRLQENPEAIDLILTDMTMPKMTGIELAHRAHEIKPATRIVLCSGFSDRLKPESLQAEGIREFVQKPFQISQVAQSLRRELDRPS
ncbi:MAG: ATP-binding protein [Holophagaceae bacterium]|nr:ATP-binding protein [Holophagaceae bacterium]